MKILTMKLAMLLALLSATTAYGQIRPIIDDGDDCLGCGPTTTVSLSGTTNVNLNSTYAYTVSVSSGLHSASNYSVSGGQIISQSRNSVSVKWTSTGSRWVRVTATVSGSLHTSTKSVVVTAPLVGGSVSASTTTSICSGINPGVINNSQAASGGSGSISYQWQVLSDGGVLEQSLEGPIDGGSGTSWNNISGATSATYDPPKLYQNTSYRRRAKSGTQTSYSNAINYQVAAPLNKGSISYSGGAVNPGVKPSKISGTTATGGNGISYRWQWKQGTATSFTNIPTNLGSSVTSRDYQPQGLTKKTVFRRRVTSCGQNQYTNQVTINVNLLPGSISGNQTICPGGDPSNISSTAAASGGNGSYSYKWEKREYRPSSDSPIEPVGLEGGGSTNPAPTTTYVWTGWTQVGSGTTYNPGTQTFKTQYRRKVTSNGSTKYSNVVTKNVYSSAVPGSISYTGGAINSGSTPSRINGTTGSGGTSVTYQWQKKTTGGYSNITGATGKNYQSGSLTRTTSFKRLTTTNCGITAESNAITIHVNLNPGSIASGSETICRGSNPGAINSNAAASGGVGNYKYQWQVFSDLNLSEIESLEGGGSIQDNWHDLPGETNQTFDPPALTMNMAYRRKVTSGSEVAYTAAKSYSVSTPLTAGSISYTGGAVNADGNPPNIAGTTPTGGLSLDYQWQQKVGNASNYTNISGAKGKDYNPPAGIDYTTSYKRRVKSCGETKFSNVVTVTVNFSAGSISGNQTICPGSNPSIITSTSPANGGKGGYTYTWLKREYKPLDSTPEENPFEGGGESVETPTTQYAWTGWVSVGTGTSHDPDPVHYKTQYKRKVVSGGVTKYSNVITKNVYAPAEAGTLSYSGGAINPGGTPSQSITGSAGAGGSSVSYQWQSRTNGSYSNITGATNQNYQPGSLNRTTTFQRLTTTNCGSTAASNEIQIKVNLNPGSIASGNETICRGSNPALISSNAPASGGVGNYQYQWQVFTDLVLNPNESLEGGGAIENQWHDIEGETNQTFDPPSLAMNMTYRRKVTSGTEEAFTAAKSYTVSAPLTAGSISYSGGAVNPDADPSRISGTTPTGGLTLDYQWQRKVGNAASFSNISGAKSKNYNPPAGIDYTTVYKRRVKSCGETKFSNPITINVNFSPGSISGNQTICAGEIPTTITSNSPAKGGAGDYDYQWERRQYRPSDLIIKDGDPFEGGGSSGSGGTEPVWMWSQWEDIPGESGLSLSPDAQHFKTEYRRSVKSGSTTKNSNVVLVNLVDLIDAGSIDYTGGMIAAGQIPGAITGTAITSNASFSYQWQKKIGSAFVDIPGETNKNYIPSAPLHTSTSFQRVVKNDCGVVLASNTERIGVILTPGEITTSATIICHGCSTPTIEATDPEGGSGSYNYQWQVLNPLLQPDEELLPEDRYVDILENGRDASLSARPIFLNSTFRREVKSDGQTVYSQPITVSVYPILNAGLITYGNLVCEGNSPGEISGTPATGGNNSYEYQWQYFDGTNWVQLVKGSQYQNYDPTYQLSADTKFRRRVRSAGSAWKKSNVLTIELHELATNTGPLSAPSDKICSGVDVRFSYSPNNNINTNKTYLQVYRNNKWNGLGKIKNSKTVQVFEGDRFRVKYDQPCNGDIYSNEVTLTLLQNCNIPPSMDQNFVRTEIASIPTSSELKFSKANNYEKQTNYTYLDGLGREVMSIATESGVNNDDVIQYTYYNESTGEKTISYLPYGKVSRVPGEFQTDPVGDLTSYYGGTQDVTQDQRFFGEAFTEPSPLSRPKEELAFGKAWETAHAKIKINHLLYNAGGDEALPKWRLKSGGYPERDGIHAAKTLTIEEVIDEANVKTQVLIDQLGRKVADRTWNEGEWLTTYYVYDEMDRMRCVLPPEIATVSSTTNSEVNKYGFLYKYDGYGRVIEKRLPGQLGWHYFIYDKWDRLVLTQDPNLRKNDKWLFTKFDELNRPIMTGLLTSSSDVDDIRSYLGSTILIRNESYTGSGVEGYSNSAYPIINSTTELLTVTYYDNYNYLARSEWGSTYDFKNVGLEGSHAGHSYQYPSSRDNRVKGMATGSKTRNLTTNSWLKESNYYDHKGRLIQTTTETEQGGFNRVSHLFDFSGRILNSRITHKKASSGSPTNIYRRLVYDQSGRLKEVHHRLNSNDEVQIAANEYNSLGQLVGKNLHYNAAESDFEQSIDYSYNIRGWLTGINDAVLSENKDLFGLDIHYNTSAGLTGQQTLFDGNISAMKWSSFLDSDTRSYTYQYDGRKRIKDASHFSGGAAVNQYSLKGIKYDKNGNIDSLDRFGSSGKIDELTYKYKGNQLKFVEDGRGTDGFANGHTGNESNWDYAYDDNGNQIKDLNKDITLITYNHLNLPDRVEFGNGDYQIFVYDANGMKLRQEVSEGGTITKKEYRGSFIYENDELKFIKHSEGRIAFKGADADYQYYLKDHLGNTRVTFSTLPEVYEMKETFENDPGLFADLHRHTSETSNTTPGGNQVALLESMESGALGLVSVNKGDKISLTVNANYLTEPDGNSFSRTAYDVLFGSFEGSYGGGAESGGVSGATSGAFDEALLSPGMTGKDAENEAPRAFINYIFFDRDMNFKYAGFEQISTAAFGPGNQEPVSIPEFLIQEDGYVLGYLSNENQEPVSVHFDDFTISQDKVKVLFASDYYPFGLQFNEFKRTASERLRFKFQGQEHDLQTGWVQFKWRNHQPALGRFFNVDPLSEQFYHNSTYAFSENRVTNGVELEGLEFVGAGTATFMAMTEARAQVESGGDPSFGDRISAGASIIGESLHSGFVNMTGLAQLSEGATRYTRNEFDYRYNAGRNYETAIQNNEDPGEIRTNYEAEKMLSKLEMLDGGIRLWGFASGGAEASLSAHLPNAFRWTINGKTNWPTPGNGFLDGSWNVTLKKGYQIDRYGGPYGKFASPRGSSYSGRSLKPGSNNKNYHIYEFAEDFDVEMGTAQPWFGEDGMGTQFYLNQKIEDLLDQGILIEVFDY